MDFDPQCIFCRSQAEGLRNGLLLKLILDRIDEENVCESHRVDLARLPQSVRAEKEVEDGIKGVES
jgi:hypothetical protein